MKEISRNAQNIKPSGIRKFFDIVSERENAISLGVGEPDFITPWGIRDAGIRSLQKGYTQYTSNKGLPKLRTLISKYLEERFAVKFSKDNIIVTVGASEGIDLSLRAIINKGDEILIPEPCYVSYSPIVELCGGIPVPIKCEERDDFKILPTMLEKAITPMTKALIFPYPNNPTGTIMEKKYIEKLLPIIKKNDLYVITDEIYCELTYGGEHTSIASYYEMKDRTIYIGGFSKAFAMTGWRVGYICAPDNILSAMLKIHQYGILCAPSFSQYAALYALEEGFSDGFASVKEMRDEYDRRRRFMVKAFNDMGLKCFEPKGAFYVFPSVKATGLTGEDFANRLLDDQNVAVVPGDAFGESGKYYIRCSYATSMKNLTEALKRIELFIKKL